MATVNFLYRSTKEKAYLHLRLLYRFNDTDFVFGGNTKLEVTKDYWTKQHKQKRPKDIEISNTQTVVNNKINLLANYILNSFNAESMNNINKDWLILQIDNFYNPLKEDEDIPKDLTKYIEYYIDYRIHELASTSIQKFKTIKNKMEKLQQERRKPILISEINDSFKNEFVTYYKKNNYAQNTIQREFTFIKTFCRHARFLGLETSQQLDGLSIDKGKVEKIYLTFDELHKLESIEPKKLSESLNNAKDWLIISCYTGQRISDFLRFTANMIRIENGKSLIEFTQKKTNKLMTVPLHKKVLEILEKRNGQFPYSISDQRYNEFIKRVCEIAEINQIVFGSVQKSTDKKSKVYRKEEGFYKKHELITSHIGRRSFATNFYGTIPTSLLINVTGHSTEVMFLNYIGKSNKDKAIELSNYF